MKLKINKTIPSIALVILLVLSSTQLNAQIMNGNRLVEYMYEYDKAKVNTSGANFIYAGYFTGYVVAIYDMSFYLINTPAQIITKQICEIVSKYLKEHPERWTEMASILVVDALKAAFPK